MRWENVYVAGLGKYLPEQVYTAEQAVADGAYDADAAKKNGVRAVRVANDDEAGPVMAAAAGRQAIERSGHRPDDVGLVLHAYVTHQGRDLWTPAHYVQAATVGSAASAAIEMRQGCNGAMAALELAASWITARPHAPAALITSGDAFRLPYVDRWRSDDQTVFGDGACAMVLSTRGGFARLRATASRSEPSLEPIYRGQGPWTIAPFEDRKPVNLGGRPGEWLMQHEDAYDDALELVAENFSKTLQQALDDAETSLDRVNWFVHAHVIRPIAEWGFYRKLNLDPAITTYEWGLDYGHMGNCDQFLGINHLVETRRPKPGDLLVTVGVGIGFMWTVAVLEFLDVPNWEG